MATTVSKSAGATKRDILELLKKQDVAFLRLQFTDILGVNKNVEVPQSQFEKALEGDVMFDGSSIEGFVRIEESDMVLRPDLDTAQVLPYDDEGGRVARIICDIYNPDGSSFVGCTRQHEIDFRYAEALETADNLATFRFIVRYAAYRHGFLATFMPKPIFGINGSGMHTHQSLFRDGKNAFHDPKGKWELSQTALHYIAGLLRHARGFCAVTNPLVNSYKRLVPGPARGAGDAREGGRGAGRAGAARLRAVRRSEARGVAGLYRPGERVGTAAVPGAVLTVRPNP